MCIITTQKIMIDKIRHTNHKRRQYMTKYWSDSLNSQWSRQVVITVSRSTLDDHQKKWNHHQYFLYGVIGHPGYVFLN